MAKSGYEPYILPSVSVSKSRIQVCLRQDLYAEFCICILLFTHPSKWHVGCTLHSASVSCFCILYLGRDPHPVSRIPYPYPVFGAHSVSCIPYPVSVSCIWGAFCALSHVSCFFCPVFGLCSVFCIMRFGPHSVSRIPYPYPVSRGHQHIEFIPVHSGRRGDCQTVATTIRAAAYACTQHACLRT